MKTDEEMIAARKRCAEALGEAMANAIYGFGEDWLDGFYIPKREETDGSE